MDISRIVMLVYAVGGILTYWFTKHLLEWIFESVDALNNVQFAGGVFSITTMLAVITAVVATFAFYRNETVRSYLSEVVLELKKVTWPNWSTTKRSTVVVIAFTVVLSLYLALFDYIWKEITDLIIISGAS